ncbi:proteasome 26S subunit [Fistulina hepatica ATCC 64428]|nr:proteasome 26S subunit [Fistulina hepatica ATCC 64428]
MSMKSLYEDLVRSFSATPTDLKTCGKLLTQLKLGLIENSLLLPTSTERNLDDLVVARNILEMGAFCSIRAQDVPAFDRYFAQLQTFYSDYNSVLPPSQREYPIRGLHLVRLLTQNRIADFHATLESLPLPAKEIASNPYIAHPVNLERWLMEGSYSKVWSARERAPTEEYKFFIDSIMGTIRNEIASCAESAYNSLPLKDAATLLFFTSQPELATFADKRNWRIDLTTSTIHFSRKTEEKLEIPKQKLITSYLTYARELEMIV